MEPGSDGGGVGGASHNTSASGWGNAGMLLAGINDVWLSLLGDACPIAKSVSAAIQS